MKNLVLLMITLLLVACQSQTVQPENELHAQANDVDYLQLGQQHAQQAQLKLGSNLKKAMQESGPVGALSFCHEQAIPLTDSVVAGDLLRLKRVSDKNRNPGNVPNADELAYIKQAKSQLASGETPDGMVHEVSNQMVAYYPIVTQPGCLQCHGSPESDIVPETLQAINKYYPKDKATGFDVNQLRGIWVVTMAKQNN
jgi:nitrate reductase cytochrome c-type subunit